MISREEAIAVIESRVADFTTDERCVNPYEGNPHGYIYNSLRYAWFHGDAEHVIDQYMRFYNPDRDSFER